MWRLGLLISLFSLLLGFDSAHAQDQADYYGVFYDRGMARIIAFRQDRMWTVTDLPDPVLDVYPQGGYNAPIEPQWSPDGMTLYITLWKDKGGKNILYAYHSSSDQLTPLISNVDVTGCSGFITLVSLSPDGHYGLLCSDKMLRTAIIDMQSGRVVLNDKGENSTGGCYSTLFAWALADQRIFIAKHCGLMNGSSSLDLVNTSTWETTQTLALPPREWLFDPAYQIPGAKPFLLSDINAGGDYGSAIIQVFLDSGEVKTITEALDKGEALLVAPDDQFATFISDDHFARLDIETLAVTDTGVPASNCGVYGVKSTPDSEDTLYYFCADYGQKPMPMSVIGFSQKGTEQISLEQGLRQDVTLEYQHLSWSIAFHGDQNHVELHNLDGLIWSSEQAFPHSSADYSNNRGVWHYPWFSVDLVEGGEAPPMNSVSMSRRAKPCSRRSRSCI